MYNIICHQRLAISGDKYDLARFAEKLLVGCVNQWNSPNKGRCWIFGIFFRMPIDVYCGDLVLGPQLKTLALQNTDELKDGCVTRIKEELITVKKKRGKCDGKFIRDIYHLPEVYAQLNKYCGPKCEDCFLRIQHHHETQIEIRYGTPWFPILKGILFISKDNPLLTFFVDYSYEIDSFPDGEVTIKAGKIKAYREDSSAETKAKWKAFEDQARKELR